MQRLSPNCRLHQERATSKSMTLAQLPFGAGGAKAPNQPLKFQGSSHFTVVCRGHLPAAEVDESQLAGGQQPRGTTVGGCVQPRSAPRWGPSCWEGSCLRLLVLRASRTFRHDSMAREQPLGEQSGSPTRCSRSTWLTSPHASPRSHVTSATGGPDAQEAKSTLLGTMPAGSAGPDPTLTGAYKAACTEHQAPGLRQLLADIVAEPRPGRQSVTSSEKAWTAVLRQVVGG